VSGGYTFRVPAFSIPFAGSYLSSSLQLNQFQLAVRRLINDHGRDVLLVAPTGGGKTLTLLLNTEHGETGLRGFVALYPNNTLLRNQLCTVEDIIVEHMGGRLEYSSGLCGGEHCSEAPAPRRCECLHLSDDACVEPLTIYNVDVNSCGDAWACYEHVGLLALSGRYIVSTDGKPKREILYGLVRKAMEYTRRGGLYLIVFATPDTYLLVSTGAYRDFEGVGRTVHNMLVALARGFRKEELEDVLRETGALTRGEADEAVAVFQRLGFPLFVDEFHLYDPYELDALAALLKIYKDFVELPVVFSSATPASDTLTELSDTLGEWGVELRPEKVEAEVMNGLGGFAVRGETLFEVIPVKTTKGGLAAFYEACDEIPGIVLDDLLDELKLLGDGRALVIAERLWMVPVIVRGLRDAGIEVDCIASITPAGECRAGARVIVGSEATTQGVNLGRVVLGVTAGTSSEDVIQRIGRVGRRGVNSKVYLVAPERALEKAPPSGVMSYYELVSWVSKVYPDYPKRRKSVAALIPERYREVRRKLIYSVAVASHARVSGSSALLKKVSLTSEDAARILGGVISDAQSLARLLLFRRSGFTIRYRVEGGVVGGAGAEGETSIGLISRNFAVNGLEDGVLVISLEKARHRLKIYRRGVSLEPFKGKLVDLRTLLTLVKGTLSVGDVQLGPEHIQDGSFALVLDSSPDLTEYLSYTGEGAAVMDDKFAVVFV